MGFWNLLSLHPCTAADGSAPFYLGVQFELARAELNTVLVEMSRYTQQLGERARLPGAAADE